jgi:hypothetical protein
MSVYNIKSPGLGSVGSYQVSGKPFVSGAIDVGTATAGPLGPLEITFPSVTRWITITNHDTTTDGDVKVAFSALGFDTNNFFTVSRDSQDYGDTMTARLELKVTSIYLTGACTNCDVIAGLTNISTNSILNNWSGSAGVG